MLFPSRELLFTVTYDAGLNSAQDGVTTAVQYEISTERSR